MDDKKINLRVGILMAFLSALAGPIGMMYISTGAVIISVLFQFIVIPTTLMLTKTTGINIWVFICLMNAILGYIMGVSRIHISWFRKYKKSIYEEM